MARTSAQTVETPASKERDLPGWMVYLRIKKQIHHSNLACFTGSSLSPLRASLGAERGAVLPEVRGQA